MTYALLSGLDIQIVLGLLYDYRVWYLWLTLKMKTTKSILDRLRQQLHSRLHVTLITIENTDKC